MLNDEDVRFYRENGYLMVENAVTPEQLSRMHELTLQLIEGSRSVTESDDLYDLDEGHSAMQPRLTRIKQPHKKDPFFWDVLQHSNITRVINTLLGPDTAIQNIKLNTKAPGGGAAVEWHQDWAFYPHTNDDMLACGLMLEDVDEANGPLQVIPGSHRGPILAHTNRDGVFCGAVDPDDPDFHHDRAVTLTGKAGSMTVHHARILHGSAPNISDRSRMILFYECRAADAWPVLGIGHYAKAAAGNQSALWGQMKANIITGEITSEPRCEAVPMRLPLPPAPDEGSIFKTQQTGGARSAFVEAPADPAT